MPFGAAISASETPEKPSEKPKDLSSPFIPNIGANLGMLSAGVLHSRSLSVDEDHVRRILILGSGFAGLHAAQHLSEELASRRNIELTMLTDRSHFLFSPLWMSVATGGSKLSQAAIPLTKLVDDPIRLVVDRATTIDLEAREVVGERNRYPFDYLLLAVGSETDWRGHPRFEESVVSCKSGRDAVDAFEAVNAALERARAAEPSQRRGALTFTVAGGGPTGVELMARLASRFDHELRHRLPAAVEAEIRLILVEPQPTLLPDLDEDLGPIALDHLRSAGVEVRLGDSVIDCTSDRVELSSGDAYACETTFWCAGVRTPQWLTDVGFETDEDGRILVTRNLHVVGAHGVYAAGDVAGVGDVPMDADVAVSQAVVGARNIIADLAGRTRRAWEYEPYGRFISLGQANAVVKFRGMILQGRPAQAIWGGAYARLLPSALQRLALVPDLFGDAFASRTPNTLPLLES